MVIVSSPRILSPTFKTHMDWNDTNRDAYFLSWCCIVLRLSNGIQIFVNWLRSFFLLISCVGLLDCLILWLINWFLDWLLYFVNCLLMLLFWRNPWCLRGLPGFLDWLRLLFVFFEIGSFNFGCFNWPICREDRNAARKCLWLEAASLQLCVFFGFLLFWYFFLFLPHPRLLSLKKWSRRYIIFLVLNKNWFECALL